MFSFYEFEDIAIGGKRKKRNSEEKCQPLKNVQGSQYSDMYNILGQIIQSFDFWTLD